MRQGCGGLGEWCGVRALQECAIDGMADRASALDDRLYHFRLATSRQASTTRWTAAVPPSRYVRSQRDTDLDRAVVVKLEISAVHKCPSDARIDLEMEEPDPASAMSLFDPIEELLDLEAHHMTAAGARPPAGGSGPHRTQNMFGMMMKYLPGSSAIRR